MNDWQLLLQNAVAETKVFSVGKRVQLGFLGKPTGTIIEIEEPFGLLAPKYVIRWDNGDTGRCSSTDLTLLPE